MMATLSSIPAVVLALLLLIYVSQAFVVIPTVHKKWSSLSMEDEWSDFGDMVPGDDSPNGNDGNLDQLSQRIQQYRQAEEQKDVRLASNWKEGNWKVRGFVLPSKETITTLVPDVNEHVFLVGRDDGSVLLVGMGTEYLTRFESKLTAIETSNATVKIEEQLVPDTTQEETGTEQVPFSVLYQFQANGAEISTLLAVESVELGLHYVVTGDVSGNLAVWNIPDDYLDATETKTVTPVRNLGWSGSPIVTLQSVRLDTSSSDEESKLLLFSASKDGKMGLWDLWSGDLVYQCQLQSDENNGSTAICCADVLEDTIYLGLDDGHVMAYRVHEMVLAASMGDACPVPNARFVAFTESPITAICTAGKGRLAKDSHMLLVASATGVLKQYEMLPKKSSDDSLTLEHWPRLASQRMPKRAHVFEGGHDGPVLKLTCADDSKFVSAGSDGRIFAWSTTKGTELFRMEGFTTPISSLCLSEDTLITNGMGEFVCVHDFDVDDSDYDYDLEW